LFTIKQVIFIFITKQCFSLLIIIFSNLILKIVSCLDLFFASHWIRHIIPIIIHGKSLLRALHIFVMFRMIITLAYVLLIINSIHNWTWALISRCLFLLIKILLKWRYFLWIISLRNFWLILLGSLIFIERLECRFFRILVIVIFVIHLMLYPILLF
jgi:hypothetical protein